MERTMRKSLMLAGALLVAVLTGQVSAEPKVGEKPDFSYKTTDGKAVTPKSLAGRIVIIDFWATWCGPCMRMAPHMVELNKEYGDKGVAIIGVSLDSDSKSMLEV